MHNDLTKDLLFLSHGRLTANNMYHETESGFSFELPLEFQRDIILPRVSF